MKKSSLKQKWLELPEKFRTLQQMYGRNEEGCGATIGVMPKCDFACRGCYLGKEANHIPMDSIDSIKSQLRQLREYLGRWGNLQLTDGEVTLRDEKDLIEILRYANEIELIPMIMTHGDHFRKNPELLYKLVREADLREVSFHIDTTQRGRYGKDYKYAKSELELMPLRDEFAELIRSVKKETGFSLRAASTITVSNKNIDEVSKIVPWYLENSDAFRLVSFLPLSQVGRTIEGLDGVSYNDIWKQIEIGLENNSPSNKKYSEKTRWWMGHPECNKFVFGHALKDNKSGEITYRRISMAENKVDEHFFDRIYSTWPGFTLRPLSKLKIYQTLAKMFLEAPSIFLYHGPKYFYSMLKDFNPKSPLQTLKKLLNKEVSLSRLTIVTHHFMNAEELETPLGKERLKNCSFKVPYNNELISMCEMNAKDFRSKYYGQLIKLDKGKKAA